MVARILHRASQSAEVRADDNEETIKTRIATFSKNTNEILVLYPQQTRRVKLNRIEKEKPKFNLCVFSCNTYRLMLNEALMIFLAMFRTLLVLH